MKGQKKRKQKQQQTGPGEKQEQPSAKKTRSRAKSTLQDGRPLLTESQEDSRSQLSQDGLSSSAVDEGLRPCHSQQEMNAATENANNDSASLEKDRTDNVSLDVSTSSSKPTTPDHEPFKCIDISKDLESLEHLSKEIQENSSKDKQSDADCVTFSQRPVKRKFQSPEFGLTQTVKNDAKDSQIKQPKLDASFSTMEVSNSSNQTEPTDLMNKISSETDMTNEKTQAETKTKTETNVDEEKDIAVSKQSCSIDSSANKQLCNVNNDELNASHNTSSENSRNNKQENYIENKSTSPEPNQTESAGATTTSSTIDTSEVTQVGHSQTGSDKVEHNTNAQIQIGEFTQAIIKTLCVIDSQVCINTQGILATQSQFLGPTQPYLSANDTVPVENMSRIEPIEGENVVSNETTNNVINVEQSAPEIATQSQCSEILFQRKISQETKGQHDLSQGFEVTNQINKEETQASSRNGWIEEDEYNDISCNKHDIKHFKSSSPVETKEPILSTPPTLNMLNVESMIAKLKFNEESLANKTLSNLKDNKNLSEPKRVNMNLTDTKVSNMNDKTDNNESALREYPKSAFTTKIFSRSHKDDGHKDTVTSKSEIEALQAKTHVPTYQRPDLTDSRPDLTYSRPDLTDSRPDLTYSRPDLTDSQLCDALDEGDFEMEFDAAQTKAKDDIVKKRQEGESLVGTILHELRTVNKQMLRLKREIETAKRKMKPTKPVMNK